MIRLVAAFALGAGFAALAWRASRRLFSLPVFARRNVRGVDVPVGVGVLVVLAALAAEATLVLVDALRGHPMPLVVVDGVTSTSFVIGPSVVLGERVVVTVTLVVALGFALLGAIDDLAGDHADKGFGGHLRALASGRLTTGSLKLVGGGLVGLVAMGTICGSFGRIVLGAAVIALGANTANLFDRAPGRTAKVSLVAALAIVASAPAAGRPELIGVAAIAGGLAGLLVPDLREELMLGDAGANPVGAVLGLGVVLTTGVVGQGIVVALLVLVNLAGERVSFSAVIDRTPPLRALDRLGRRPL